MREDGRHLEGKGAWDQGQQERGRTGRKGSCELFWGHFFLPPFLSLSSFPCLSRSRLGLQHSFLFGWLPNLSSPDFSPEFNSSWGPNWRRHPFHLEPAPTHVLVLTYQTSIRTALSPLFLQPFLHPTNIYCGSTSFTPPRHWGYPCTYHFGSLLLWNLVCPSPLSSLLRFTENPARLNQGHTGLDVNWSGMPFISRRPLRV